MRLEIQGDRISLIVETAEEQRTVEKIKSFGLNRDEIFQRVALVEMTYKKRGVHYEKTFWN